MSHNPMKDPPVFQRRGNTLNLKKLREEAVAARYGKLDVEPQLMLQLLDQVEKADATRYVQLETLTRELINKISEYDEGVADAYQKRFGKIS